MSKAFDSASRVTDPDCFKRNDYGTAIRYYTQARSSSKLLSLDEARAICRAGLRLLVVYEDFNNSAERFDHAAGTEQARTAHDIAAGEISQPAGSAIYFAVDFDPTEADIAGRIVPYFEGIRAGLDAARGGAPGYRVGAYGCGAVLEAVAAKSLADYLWLAGAMGWRGSKAFDQSGKWHLKQIIEAGTHGFGREQCGILIDEDVINPAGSGDIGSFVIDPGAEA